MSRALKLRLDVEEEEATNAFVKFTNNGSYQVGDFFQINADGYILKQSAATGGSVSSSASSTSSSNASTPTATTTITAANSGNSLSNHNDDDKLLDEVLRHDIALYQSNKYYIDVLTLPSEGAACPASSAASSDCFATVTSPSKVGVDGKEGVISPGGTTVASHSIKKVEIGSLTEIELAQAIGQGASGLVRKGVHTPSGATVAVKVVPMDLSESKSKQILTELRTLHHCSNPHIVGFYGAFCAERSISLVLEHMNLGSFSEIIKKFSPLPEPVLAHFTKQILLGLHYLHTVRKVIHRDIKPSNILINSHARVALADFGVSGETNGIVNDKVSFVGTITYMSPERIQGLKHSFDSDIWSLGLTVMEAAIGAFPYKSPADQPPPAAAAAVSATANAATLPPAAPAVSQQSSPTTPSLLTSDITNLSSIPHANLYRSFTTTTTTSTSLTSSLQTPPFPLASPSNAASFLYNATQTSSQSPALFLRSPSIPAVVGATSPSLTPALSSSSTSTIGGSSSQASSGFISLAPSTSSSSSSSSSSNSKKRRSQFGFWDVMERIVSTPAPKLPAGGGFSLNFISFTEDCLQKDPTRRPSAKQLLQHPFITQYTCSDAEAATSSSWQSFQQFIRKAFDLKYNALTAPSSLSSSPTSLPIVGSGGFALPLARNNSAPSLVSSADSFSLSPSVPLPVPSPSSSSSAMLLDTPNSGCSSGILMLPPPLITLSPSHSPVTVSKSVSLLSSSSSPRSTVRDVSTSGPTGPSSSRQSPDSGSRGEKRKIRVDTGDAGGSTASITSFSVPSYLPANVNALRSQSHDSKRQRSTENSSCNTPTNAGDAASSTGQAPTVINSTSTVTSSMISNLSTASAMLLTPAPTQSGSFFNADPSGIPHMAGMVTIPAPVHISANLVPLNPNSVQVNVNAAVHPHTDQEPNALASPFCALFSHTTL